MIYKQATAEVILFDNSDVITTSGASGCPGNSSNPGSGGNHHTCSGNSGSNGQGGNSYWSQRFSYRVQ